MAGGRPSKLTDKQWLEIERRAASGEAIRKLAREFGISESAIREKVSAQLKEIKAVANQIVEAEVRFKALPISAQITAQTMADELRAISYHLSGAAKFGAMTAHRLSGIANDQASKIDDAEPEKSLEALQRIGILTKMANSSAEIGLNLLRANKEAVDDLNKREIAPEELNLKLEFVK